MQQNQEDNKERMQEELIRRSLQKEVSRLEAQEKARRITESKSQIGDGDDAKTKAIDMLVDVQKQLLDAFAISKVSFPFNVSFTARIFNAYIQVIASYRITLREPWLDNILIVDWVTTPQPSLWWIHPCNHVTLMIQSRD